MKKNLITILFLIVSLNLFAQRDREKIKSLKVAFITEKLNLSEKEAQYFWPIYNAYDDNHIKIKFEEIKTLSRNIKENINTLDDVKSKELLDKMVDAENRLHNEEVQLISKLRKVISPKKILLLKVAEDDFNRKLFDQYKKKRKEHLQNN